MVANPHLLAIVLGCARKVLSVKTGSKKGYDIKPWIAPVMSKSMPPSRVSGFL